jgi:hypothetical protein
MFVAALTSLWLAAASCVALPAIDAAAAPNDNVTPVAAAAHLAVLPPRSAASARRASTLDAGVLPPSLVVLTPMALRAGRGDTPRDLPPASVPHRPRARAPPLG